MELEKHAIPINHKKSICWLMRVGSSASLVHAIFHFSLFNDDEFRSVYHERNSSEYHFIREYSRAENESIKPSLSKMKCYAISTACAHHHHYIV